MSVPKVKKTAATLFANKDVQKKVMVELSAMEKENKKIQSFMMEQSLKGLLKNHFNENGLSWGAGIRMVLIEYMKREKVLK